MSDRIYIFDTTLRDGEQSPGVNLNIQEKLEIAKQLSRLNVDVIEAGFPIASKGDFEAVKAIAENIKGPSISGLARAVKQDIDRAWEAVKASGKPRIHTFLATSNVHLKYKLKMTKEEVLDKAIAMVKYAKGLCPNIEFSPEDASRTDIDFLYMVLEAVIDAGADVVNIPDTVGYSTPREFGRIIKGIKDNVPNINKAIISVHCHNDLGLAVANSLAAIENGANQIECTINGLGERAGNAAMEEVVMALNTRKDYYDKVVGLDTTQIYKTSTLISFLTGMSVQANKAIVGANAFAHESGIHQHGVLSERTTYEIMTPESIGLKQSKMVLGKLSGRHAFEQKLKDMGYTLEKEVLNQAFERFKDLADKKKVVLDKDIEALVSSEKVAKIPAVFVLDSFYITSGNKETATSRVILKHGEEIKEESATGDGPIDAVFKAIEKAVGMDIQLKDYFIKAVTAGKDAMGEVTVKISRNGDVYLGRGLSTDIIEASVIAYINAINKMMTEKNIESSEKEES